MHPTCPGFVRSFARLTPDAPALVADDETLSYAALDDAVQRLAEALDEVGVPRGAHVALALPNGVDLAVALLAAMASGRPAALVPPSLPAAEVAFRLRAARVTAVLTDVASIAAGSAIHDGAADAGVPCLSVATLRAVARSHTGRRAGSSGGTATLGGAPDDDALLLFTSGTTGTPKTARIAHASLVAHTLSLVHHRLRLEAADRTLAVLPITHSFGARIGLLAPLCVGASCRLVARFDTAKVHALLAETPITVFPAVPTMLASLDGWPELRGRPLRLVLSAGAPLPTATRAVAERVLGVPVCEAYGLTEATLATVADPRDPGDRGTVGRAVPGVEVLVVDDAGAPRPAGEVGEVWIRGHDQMTGYLDDPDATAALLERGFTKTGDLGVLSPEGRLVLVDRKKDLVLRGGYNVVPAKVEAALCAFPGIDGALVFGVPDARLGEEVAALIATRAEGLDAEALDAHLRASLPRTDRPRLIRSVAALPLGPSGKALRREARAWFERGEGQPLELGTPRTPGS